MSARTPEQIAGNWDQVARSYAEHIDSTTARYAADTVRLAEVGRDDRVLDVASGPGAATLLAAPLAQDVLAIDFSSEMCDALRERVSAGGVSNVTVREMDAQDLDLPDDHFDVALSSFGAMICPDRTRAFAEMARVTRPSGRLAASCWQAPPNNDWLEIFMTTVVTAMPDADPPTPPPFIHTNQTAPPPRLLAASPSPPSPPGPTERHCTRPGVAHDMVGEDGSEPAVASVSVVSVVPVGDDLERLETERRGCDIEPEDLCEVLGEIGWHGGDEVGVGNEFGGKPERGYRPDDSTFEPEIAKRCLGGSTSSAERSNLDVSGS